MDLARSGRLFTLTLLAVALAGTANAGYWKTIYDLAPGSSNTTVNGGGTFVDLINGELEIHYDAAGPSMPITGARLVAGNTFGNISQPVPPILTVTGTNATTLSPPASGTPGTLSGAILNLSVVANSSTTGFLHCYETTPTISGLCPIVFTGVLGSNPVPQTMSGPFTFNAFTFSATAGVGDFTSPPILMMPTPTVNTSTVYAGREISRVWVGDVPSMGLAGSGALILGMLLSGWKGARRKA